MSGEGRCMPTGLSILVYSSEMSAVAHELSCGIDHDRFAVIPFFFNDINFN